MSIAPVVKTVEVKAPPARAFDLFANRIGAWWPQGRGVGQNPCVDVRMEPMAGGRLYEIDADGTETPWGDVLVWEPPRRLLIAWRLGAGWKYDPAVHTEVEVIFEPLPSGGARVTLEHRKLEGFGDAAATLAEQLRGGWSPRMQNYADFTETQA